ncbi:MAG: ABC transporter permease [Bryobacterales bacterium]|nr:ABC transporter permease [Bryobacterales bacterium]
MIAVLGKLFPYTLLSLVTAVVMVTILFRLVNVPLRGSLLTIAMASLLLVLAYQGIGFLLVALTANLRMATSLAAFYTGPALAYMGISFPQMGMPAFGQFWGNLLPVTHYVRLLVGQGIRGDDWPAALPDLGRLTLFVLVPWLLAMIRIGPVLRSSRYWGRT